MNITAVHIEDPNARRALGWFASLSFQVKNIEQQQLSRAGELLTFYCQTKDIRYLESAENFLKQALGQKGKVDDNLS